VRRAVALLLPLLALAAIVSQASSASQTIGLFINDPASYGGYTLFKALGGSTTYLIDAEGNSVHSWPTGPGLTVELENDGTLWLAWSNGGSTAFNIGGETGGVRQMDWDGSVLWEYAYTSPQYVAHHDIEVLPNGNVLILAWEYKSSADAIAEGRIPSLLAEGSLAPEQIIEVQPTGPTTGNIVWQWNSWDHLIQDFDQAKPNYGVVADHPELIDLNYIGPTRPANGEADWHHANSVQYNADLDQIVISVRHFSEIWVIDHSTTTEEAAGHTGGNSGKGGDLLYRWGNPEAYGQGGPSHQALFLQHDARWIEPGLPGAGNILIFSNGNGRGYSSVDEITPPVDVNGNYALAAGQAYGPASPTWTYNGELALFSNFISGAVRLPNGNTFIDFGQQGTFLEVTSSGDIVWRYVSPLNGAGPLLQGSNPGSQNNSVFRAYRYGADFPGVVGQDLTPGAPLEIADSDKDGLSDAGEVFVFFTDPFSPDTDSDGCGDGAEVGPNENLGGLRSPLLFWDFFDVPAAPSFVRDRAVSFVDFFAVLQRFGATGGPGIDPLSAPPAAPAYHTAYDRGPPAGPNEWNLTMADGSIATTDIFSNLAQFGHRCD
jgi:hypothetical protein